MTYLRIVSNHSFKGGVMNRNAFRCNEGLSFYERRAPLDTPEGAQVLRDSRSKAHGLKLGLFELSEEDMRPFGLCPRLSPDLEDPEFGDYHAEAECFETIFGVDEASDHDHKITIQRVMNLRKDRLAQIAQKQMLLPVPD